MIGKSDWHYSRNDPSRTEVGFHLVKYNLIHPVILLEKMNLSGWVVRGLTGLSAWRG